MLFSSWSKAGVASGLALCALLKQQRQAFQPNGWLCQLIGLSVIGVQISERTYGDS